MTLDADDIDAIAARVAELLRETPATPAAMIDAKAKAQQMSMALDDIYRHATELGGVKIGGRWRFPATTPTAPPKPPPTTKRHKPVTTTTTLLPIHE